MPGPDRVVLARASKDELIVMLLAFEERLTALEGLPARVVELEAALAAARSTSRTSSKPPSSDGYAKPAPSSRRTRSGREPGGQPGAPGSTLRQVEVPDVVLEHRPAACSGCAGPLAGVVPLSWAARQVADLPPVELVWTEHRVATVACSCGARTTAD